MDGATGPPPHPFPYPQIAFGSHFEPITDSACGDSSCQPLEMGALGNHLGAIPGLVGTAIGSFRGDEGDKASKGEELAGRKGVKLVS